MEEDFFDPKQHSFAAHVRYDGLKLAIHAGPDIDNIPSNSTKNIKWYAAYKIVDTIYYPRQVRFFNTLSQPTLVDWFIQEVKARSPDQAEKEIYGYISRLLTYGHKIGRAMYKKIATSVATDNLSPDDLCVLMEREIQQEKEERTFIAKHFATYEKELDRSFPKMAAYFEQDYTAESNYTRIEKEDIQTELLFFGIENYIKNIAWRDPWLFIHHN
jgi:hypothetical protein